VIVAENHGVEVELPFEGKKLQVSIPKQGILTEGSKEQYS
jgi:hypothetical protein